MLAIKPASGKPFLRTSPELEREIGDKAGKLLLQIDYWIRIGKNFIDGKWWTYQSTRDIQAKAFPGWALSTINRAIKRLDELGLIEIGNHNKIKYDKTRWFALKAEGVARLQSIILLEDEPHSVQDEPRSAQNDTGSTQNEPRSAQNGTTIPETPTLISTAIPALISTSSTPARDVDGDDPSQPPESQFLTDPKAQWSDDDAYADSANQPASGTEAHLIPPVPPPPLPPDDARTLDVKALQAFFTGCKDADVKALIDRCGYDRIYETIKANAANDRVRNLPGLVWWQLQMGGGGAWKIPQKVAQPDSRDDWHAYFENSKYKDFIQH